MTMAHFSLSFSSSLSLRGPWQSRSIPSRAPSRTSGLYKATAAVTQIMCVCVCVLVGLHHRMHSLPCWTSLSLSLSLQFWWQASFNPRPVRPASLFILLFHLPRKSFVCSSLFCFLTLNNESQMITPRPYLPEPRRPTCQRCRLIVASSFSRFHLLLYSPS